MARRLQPAEASSSIKEQIVSAPFAELVAASAHFDEQLVDFFEPDEACVFQVRAPLGTHGNKPGVLVYISPKPGARMRMLGAMCWTNTISRG